MRRITVAALLLLLAPCMSLAAGELAGSTAEISECAASSPALRESTVTRVHAASEPHGIGHCAIVGIGGCTVYDDPATSVFGYAIEVGSAAWVVWSLEAIPSNAVVLHVEVEHYLWPDAQNDPGAETVYSQLAAVPLPPPECNELRGQLWGGPVYVEVPMGTSAGLRRHELGVLAREDVQAQVSGRGLFAVAIMASGPGLYAYGDLPGWSGDGADLLVTWRDPSPVEAVTWGRVKSQYSNVR